jgi:hypothetical protein
MAAPMVDYLPYISSLDEAISVFIWDSALHRSLCHFLQRGKFFAR